MGGKPSRRRLRLVLPIQLRSFTNSGIGRHIMGRPRPFGDRPIGTATFLSARITLALCQLLVVLSPVSNRRQK